MPTPTRRDGQRRYWSIAFHLGDEILGEFTQQAADDALLLLSEITAVLVRDAAETTADDIDIAHGAMAVGENLEMTGHLTASLVARAALSARFDVQEP